MIVIVCLSRASLHFALQPAKDTVHRSSRESNIKVCDFQEFSRSFASRANISFRVPLYISQIKCEPNFLQAATVLRSCSMPIIDS